MGDEIRSGSMISLGDNFFGCMLTEGGTLSDFRKLTEKSEGKFCMVDFQTADGKHLRAAAVGDGSAYGLGNVVGNAAGGGQDEICRLHERIGEQNKQLKKLSEKVLKYKPIVDDITKHSQYPQLAEKLDISADIKKHPQYPALEKAATEQITAAKAEAEKWQANAAKAYATADDCKQEIDSLKELVAQLRGAGSAQSAPRASKRPAAEPASNGQRKSERIAAQASELDAKQQADLAAALAGE